MPLPSYPLHETARRARDLTEADRAALRAELRRGLKGSVRTERAYRLLYATDASIYQMEPAAIVFPEDAAEVQHVLRVAAAARVPVLPRGGGTALAGQSVNHAIVMDFTTRMKRIIEIDAAAGWALVEPGLVLTELNRAAAPFGLHYPIDPSTANRATIGGGIGNNSCGAHSLLYGKTIDQVLSLDAILADGAAVTFGTPTPHTIAPTSAPGIEGRAYQEVARIAADYADEVRDRFPKIMRRVSGYNLDDAVRDPADLRRLIVGSEGTLAVVTAAKVRLAPLPRAKALAAVHFRSVPEAAQATVAALAYGPSAVELVDDFIIRRCRASPGFRHLADYIEGDPGGVLLVEFYGEDDAEALAGVERLRAGLERAGLGYATVATADARRQRDMWRMREAGLGLIMSVRGDAKPVAFVEDTAVDPERLPEFVRRFAAIVGARGLETAYYGHASVGCLHMRPMVNVKSEAGLRQMRAVAEEVADLVLEFGGSLSGEHGDGILRGVFTERMFGERLTRAFRQVKAAFDPDSILNPGKIVDTPGFDENLRLSPATFSWEPRTYLDFSPEGGMARAAQQCNGQAACRKLDGGMCPSFMVTGDEEHSTRGRANLLRLVFDGVMPAAELGGDALHHALDLCVECKACKAECPSGVDMAKLKYEALAQRNDARGVPLRSRMFADIARLSRLASGASAVFNALAGLGPARAAMQRALGVHARRPLPRLAPTTFEAWFRRRGVSTSAAPRGEAVYFVDTFTNYYHPEVGRAAVAVLEALGYRVSVVPQARCCGRPAISQGMLKKAIGMAERNLAALRPYASAGVPVVGTEPSCLLTFRDEYPDLLRNDDSRVLADASLLLDELIARLPADEAAAAFSTRGAGEVLLHAHCHQKAGPGAEITLRALALAGYSPRLVDSGCCGMAGAFGFEAEHYEVSRAMGAYRLFPAVEAAASDTSIAVTGVSCRQQIGHFTSRRPRHAVELLAEALATRAQST